MKRCVWLIPVVVSAFGQAPAPAPGQPKPAAAKPAAAQKSAPAKTAPVKPAAAKPASLVDSVIDLKKAGMGDELIIKAILRENKPVDVGIADLKRLKEAGLSDRVIGVLMDPASARTAAPAPTPAATPATPAATPAPAATANSVIPATPAPVPGAPTPVPSGPVKRRLVIEPFDYSTVRSVSQAMFKTEVDIGNGIRALLTKRVQEQGKITILERAKIKSLLQEQDFGASNRVQRGTNAKIGRITGADAVLLGDIVAFGRDDRDQRVDVSAIPGARRIPGMGGLRIGKKEDKAIVVINYRIVDAETGEIIDTGEARGESKRTSNGVGGMVSVKGTTVAGATDMTSSNFAQTIIGEAVMEAADKIAATLNAKIPNLPAKAVEVEARVADAAGAQLTISAGSEAGVKVGDRFEVFRIVSEVKDPVTKEVLDLKLDKVGDLIIASVRDRIATGNYGGRAAAAVGYVVQKKVTQ
ncbi:MAG: hypothetical protein JNK87_39335 [Bryobacterales bacterium]|nr:hypothetical protein [Bryobacterales bacterium]